MQENRSTPAREAQEREEFESYVAELLAALQERGDASLCVPWAAVAGAGAHPAASEVAPAAAVELQAGPMGLSMSHSGPSLLNYQYAEWGKGSYYCAVRRKEEGRKREGKEVRRGAVTHFSQAAARRMKKAFSTIDRSRLPCEGILATLTYHDSWPDDWPGLRAHLKAFWHAIKRRYPQASAIGVKEPQKRQVPHFHMVIFGVEHIPKGELAAIWNGIVAPGDLQHLHAGTRVERVRKGRQIAGYFAKYASKGAGQADGHLWGNRWFTWGRNELARTIVEAELNWDQYNRLRRAIVAWWHAHWRDCPHREFLKRIAYAPMAAAEFERLLGYVLWAPSSSLPGVPLGASPGPSPPR